jgi:hypothetical protein
MRPYIRRKRFKSDQARQRAERTAERVRRHRLYQKAVAAGHPKALAAEAARNPMRPINDFDARLAALPWEQRQPFKAEYARVLAECQANMPGAHERYLKLRGEVIAELVMFS